MREDDQRDRRARGREVARPRSSRSSRAGRGSARSTRVPRGSACARLALASPGTASASGAATPSRRRTRSRLRRTAAPRDRPKSAPPTGGAPSRTIDIRAIATLDASASCGCGTTAFIAPLDARAVDDRRARVDERDDDDQPVAAWCRRTAAPRTPSAEAPTTSRAIISRRRSKRSAATPAARSADERRELDRADVAGLRRRAGQCECEQRVGDPGDARPEGREAAARSGRGRSRGSAAAGGARSRLHRRRQLRRLRLLAAGQRGTRALTRKTVAITTRRTR